MKLNSIVTFCAPLIFAISFHFSTAASLTVDLIHRDFIRSPSLVSSLTSSRILINALRRSFNRIRHDYFRQTASADVFSDRGEYLMRFSIGTPPVETLAVADTGSDLTWIQCKPCADCFHQNAPLFEPKLSSSYNPISCSSTPCESLLGGSSCDGSRGTCRYRIGYGDRSYSNGYLARETVTLGSIQIPNVVLGCGHDDRGTFGAGAAGIVGLGGGKASLISQLETLTQGKFSYCLGSFLSGSTYPSKMSFGDDADVSGDDVAKTALVDKSPSTFYFVTLEGISVGSQRIDYYTPATPEGSKEVEAGNIIIDSGTTLTFLPKELYGLVVGAVRREMELEETEDPEGLLGLCYVSRSFVKFPVIVFHFRGADLALNPVNTFVKTGKNCVCLGFAEASSVAIYGNLAQMDFLVGYDLGKRTLSFKPKDCSKS